MKHTEESLRLLENKTFHHHYHIFFDIAKKY